MPFITGIANSRMGRVAGTLAVIGTAACLPAYEVVNPPAVYSQAPEAQDEVCRASERIKNLSRIMEEDVSLISKAYMRGDYPYCEGKLLTHLENLKRMEDAGSDFINCMQSSGKELTHLERRNFHASFESLKERKASTRCMLGDVYEVLGEFNKAMENYTIGHLLYPSNKDCSDARKNLMDRLY